MKLSRRSMFGAMFGVGTATATTAVPLKTPQPDERNIFTAIGGMQFEVFWSGWKDRENMNLTFGWWTAYQVGSAGHTQFREPAIFVGVNGLVSHLNFANAVNMSYCIQEWPPITKYEDERVKEGAKNRACRLLLETLIDPQWMAAFLDPNRWPHMDPHQWIELRSDKKHVSM